MKTPIVTILFPIVTMATAVWAQAAGPGVTALTIIADSSWSCEAEIGDIRALTRQPILRLEPGDYLEIISARAGKPRIQLAQTIKTGDAQEMKNIDAAIGKLRSYFLSDASLPNALDMAVRRLNDACSRRQIDHVVIIIFTDGRVSDSHARQILQLWEKTNAKGWSLYLTGTKYTNRILLVAASKGLNWSLLSEASPELWLRRTRERSETAGTPENEAAAPEPHPSAEGQSVGVVAGLSREVETEAGTKQQSTSTDATQDGLRMKIDASVSVGAPGNRPGTGSSLSQERVPEANEPAVPSTVERPRQEASQPPASRQSWWQRMKPAMRRHWWLALVPLAVLGVGLIWGMAWATGEARKWEQKAGSKVKPTRPHATGVLVLRYGDRTYQQGSLDRFIRASIGRHPDNAVRLMDESVQDHHLCIYRRGTELMVQNLANTPIKVNTVEVKPRGRYRVGLPGTIQLNDKIKLTLEVLTPTLNRQEDGSASHEKSTEKARV
jgi:hypothetical protein